MKATVLGIYYPTFDAFVQAIREFFDHLDCYADDFFVDDREVRNP